MSDKDRAAALMRQRMMRDYGGSNAQAGAPPPRQRRTFSAATTAPHRVPQPTRPRGLVPTDQITGYGSKIPPSMDPANRYNNKVEHMDAASPAAGGAYAGVNTALCLVFLIVVGSSVFVIPRQFRVFWMLFVGLTILLMTGFKIYRELMAVAEKESDDKDKYTAWALAVLYAIGGLYSVVMVALLFVMAWKIYGVVTSRSNLLGSGEAPEEAGVHRAKHEEDGADEHDQMATRRSRHRRRRPTFM